jgi:hypothetical protein
MIEATDHLINRHGVGPAGGPPGALNPRINLEMGGPSRLPVAGWGSRHAVRYRTQRALLPTAISD